MICAIDTETGGLDVMHSDIIEIAVVPLPGQRSFNTLIRPWIAPNPEALKFNGITRRQLREAPEPEEALDAFLTWWQDELGGVKIEPLGHNYAFDKPFISDWLDYETYASIFDYHHRDTYCLAAAINDAAITRGQPQPFESLKLEGLATYFHLPQQEHRALGDAQLTAQVYQELLKLV